MKLQGQPPTAAAGGVLEHLVHSLSITCRAGAIPEAIRLDMSVLGLDQGIHVRDLKLPPEVTVDADPDLLLVHIVSRAATPEPEEGAAEAASQPEVIKPERKEKEE